MLAGFLPIPIKRLYAKIAITYGNYEQHERKDAANNSAQRKRQFKQECCQECNAAHVPQSRRVEELFPARGKWKMKIVPIDDK